MSRYLHFQLLFVFLLGTWTSDLQVTAFYPGIPVTDTYGTSIRRMGIPGRISRPVLSSSVSTTSCFSSVSSSYLDSLQYTVDPPPASTSSYLESLSLQTLNNNNSNNNPPGSSGATMLYLETLQESLLVLTNSNQFGALQANANGAANTASVAGVDIGVVGLAHDTNDGNPNDEVEDKENNDKKQELMTQIKEAGMAGILSFGLVQLAFWGLSVPVVVGGYYQVTGHWPDLSKQDDLQQLGAESFAFVNIARLAAPLRIAVALGAIPFMQNTLGDRFGGSLGTTVEEKNEEKEENNDDKL